MDCKLTDDQFKTILEDLFDESTVTTDVESLLSNPELLAETVDNDVADSIE